MLPAITPLEFSVDLSPVLFYDFLDIKRAYLRMALFLCSRRLLKNAHLPFDRPFETLRVLSDVEGLMALSGSTNSPPRVKPRGNVEGLRCPHPSSLRRTGLYVSLLRISGGLYLSVFEQPVSRVFFSALIVSAQDVSHNPKGE
jgi:hypothetical protein